MIFIISSVSVPASASNVAVKVEGLQVHEALDLSLAENVTTLPPMTTSVNDASDPNLTSSFSQALKSADPTASASNANVLINSSSKGLNLTATMDIEGASQRNGDIVTANMTWLPFAVTSDLRAQNLSFNTVGKTYFRPITAYYANASRFVGRPNATITGVIFYVNGTSVSAPSAEDYVGNFTTLNFGSINPDIALWNRTYTLSNNTTTWRAWPPGLLNFNMQIQRRNVTTSYVATYGYTVTISVPGVGRAQGASILVEVGSGQMEWLMAAIVVLTVVCAIAVQLTIRSRGKKLARFQRK